MKYLLIDERMRDVEKQTLKNLGYELIEIKKSTNVYPEISSHVDIFACKIKDKVIVEKSAYKMLKNKLNNKYFDIGYIDGANHSYYGKEDVLASEICGFLKEIY